MPGRSQCSRHHHPPLDLRRLHPVHHLPIIDPRLKFCFTTVAWPSPAQRHLHFLPRCFSHRGGFAASPRFLDMPSDLRHQARFHHHRRFNVEAL